jgi:two-component system sensor kinase FixL
MTDPANALELQALLDAAVDAIVIIDHEGRIKTFNRAAERIFGYREADLIGRNVSVLMPEPDRSAHDAYLKRYLTTGIPHIIGIGREVTAQRRDGSLLPVSLSVGRIPHLDPPRFVGFVHDITLRREALAAVQRERDRANQYLEVAEVVLLALDADRRIALINRKGCELLGTTDRDLIGHDWLEFVVPEDREAAAACLAAAVDAGGTAAQECEYRVLAPANGPRIIAWRIVALRDGASPVNRLLCSGDDVTDRRHAELQSNEAQRQLTHVARLATMGEMAAGIAHEINQPLAAIANYATACERMVGTPNAQVSEIQEALRDISQQALRAGEIIRRLRNLVRNRTAQREPAELNAVVEEACGLARSDARLHEVQLRLELAPHLPAVRIDKIQIQQVLLNLVRNAVEALGDRTDLRREVIVRTQPHERYELEISVSDFGPGVDPAIVDRMFHPFQTTKDQGTGLGLAISRTIVEAQEGTLGYRPNSPTGACFYVRLPAAQEIPE